MKNSRQRGLSLVELMVGIAIGMILVTAMALIFANISKNRSELEKTNRQVENGRYALELLSNEIQLAGYLGDLVLSSYEYVNPVACSSSDFGMETNTKKRPFPTFGYQSNAGSKDGQTANTNKPACVSSTNSDVISVRRVGTQLNVIPATLPTGYFLQTSNCGEEIITNKTHIVANSIAAFVLHNKSATNICSDATLSGIRKLNSYYFYVDPTDYTLKRVSLDTNTTETLVEGIEYIHFEYTLDSIKSDGTAASDTEGDGVADVSQRLASEISSDCTTSEICWPNVVGVTVYLVAKATDATPEFTSPASFALGRDTYTPTASLRKFKKGVHVAYIAMPNNILRKQTP